jgi:syringate O-demethylase/vanillate/3-O-methylgallate O-demethylase
MPVLYVKGPDAQKMLQYLTPASFANLSTSRAKQYFAITPRGHHIGDCVLYYYGEKDGFELISGMPVLNWVRFHAETGAFNVSIRFDATSPFNPEGKRTKYRFQVEGPNARAILDAACVGGFPEIKFFNIADVNMHGHKVMVLRHGMVGHAGAEISGPYEELDAVRNILLRIGEKYGLRQAGSRAYFSTATEDCWIPYPLQAIYTGEELRKYREWLPADSWEANAQLAGSLYSDNIEDYYWTPSGLGYDRFVKFDHDFIGRPALEAALGKPRRVKRALVWKREDVLKIYESQLKPGPLYKAIEQPTSYFGFPQADEVLSQDGKRIGMSLFSGYNINERDMMSLCCIDEEYADLGREVVITWGEVNGGSRKPHVERHEQTTIRATVNPTPYSKTAQAKLRAVI